MYPRMFMRDWATELGLLTNNGGAYDRFLAAISSRGGAAILPKVVVLLAIGGGLAAIGSRLLHRRLRVSPVR
jgi:hypothetical protein